jgi:hypothetical protein
VAVGTTVEGWRTSEARHDAYSHYDALGQGEANGLLIATARKPAGVS